MPGSLSTLDCLESAWIDHIVLLSLVRYEHHMSDSRLCHLQLLGNGPYQLADVIDDDKAAEGTA